MSAALQLPWTAEQFLDWAERQEERYEFDGTRPVAMTGGNARHTRVTINLHSALRGRLRGTKCSHYGPDLGVQTIPPRIRYPDVVLSCTPFPDADKLVRNPVIVFEVVSPTSGGMDRVTKLTEYQAVPTILRYVIIETGSAGLQVFHRPTGTHDWTAHALPITGTLDLPEAATAIPVAELYADTELAAP